MTMILNRLEPTHPISEAAKKIAGIQHELVAHITREVNNGLDAFIIRYLEESGIKQPFTKGKMKWQGIRISKSQIPPSKMEYRIERRGVAISPVFTVDFELGKRPPTNPQTHETSID